MFTTKFNTPLNAQIVWDAIKKIVDEINSTRDVTDEFEMFSCHCFRHTFATRCFEAGIKPKTVQSYLGHATLQMTMDLYTSVFPDYMSEEMNRLNDAYERLNNDEDNIEENRYNNCWNSPQKLVNFGDYVAI